METLEAMSTPSGNIPVSGDVEMRTAAKPTLVPNLAGDIEHREDAEMEDLFGNDDNLEAKEEDDGMNLQGSGIEGTPTSSQSDERQLRERLEYEEPDDPADVIHEVTEANVSIPNLPVPKSSDGDHWVIRMPNFVKVDSKPFHPDTYMGPEHDDEELQQGENLRERSMTIKLKVENTVRWRWAKDEFGQDIRQSNSRIIRWSDGSLSLRLGKELFDINQSIDTSGGVGRGLFGGSQLPQYQNVPPVLPRTGVSGTKSQGLTYLVAQHKRAQLLQAEAAITGYMTLRPTGMQSETHRMLVRAVGQKHNKVARLRMAPDPKMDPEREVAELMKVAAKKSKKRAEDESGGRKRRSGHSRKRAADVWSDDDEEPEDMGSEDEDDDIMGGLPKAKAKLDDEAKKRDWEYEEDDFVVADSSDEGSGGGIKTIKRQRADDDMEEDPLDQMEAKLREQDREGKKKRHRKTGETKEVSVSDAQDKIGDGDGQDDGDEEMDVESEEVEEEIKVRRVGTGPRKKRAIDFEEEEE